LTLDIDTNITIFDKHLYITVGAHLI
jgi:hypothetical protein